MPRNASVVPVRLDVRFDNETVWMPPDRLHPDAKGTEMWREALMPYLDTIQKQVKAKEGSL